MLAAAMHARGGGRATRRLHCMPAAAGATRM
eukprot:COSAG01_NODE_3735_length_5748_cov_33.771464_1_plen_31_part_00